MSCFCAYVFILIDLYVFFSLQGEDGSPGTPGRKGSDGDEGETGMKGDPVVTDPIPAMDGRNGSKGDQGIKGDEGIKGVKGQKGDGPPIGGNISLLLHLLLTFTHAPN